MKLRDYQEDTFKKVIESLQEENRTMVQAPTGFGKTVLFSHLIKNYALPTLVIVHRKELYEQSKKAIKAIGGTGEIWMVETLSNRIKKGEVDLAHFDLIIVDEAHRAEFKKILVGYTGKVIGFTATPYNTERGELFYQCTRCKEEKTKGDHCCVDDRPGDTFGDNMVKPHYRQIPLSTYYHNLISGATVPNLIEEGYLCDEDSYSTPLPGKIGKEYFDLDNKGEFKDKQQKEHYSSPNAVTEVLKEYEKHLLDQKTLIFCNNITVADLVGEAFQEAGHNSQVIHSRKKGDREEAVEWFRQSTNGILINVDIFTTGFDVPDVTGIILNRATTSVNLYTQMVGRGSRTHHQSGKAKFTTLDFGDNVRRFGKWSEGYDDWPNLFFSDTPKKKGAKREIDAEIVCPNCGAILSARVTECEFCNTVFSRERKVGSLVQMKQAVPKAKFIVNNATERGMDLNQARNYTHDLFLGILRTNRTPVESVERALINGSLKAKLTKHLTPIYFALDRSKLPGNHRVKLDTFINKLIEKIKKSYKIH